MLLIPLALIISLSSQADDHLSSKKYELSNQKSNSTSLFIEIPKSLEVKKAKDKLVIYRFVVEDRGTHVKSHSFTKKIKKTPPGVIDTIEDKGFKLKYTESFQQLGKKAIAIINYELLSGSYKGLKVGDKYTNTFTYDLSNGNKVYYQFTHSLNGKKPITVNATYN